MAYSFFERPDSISSEATTTSVFQCRLSQRRRIELKFALGEIIDHAQDHVVILDLGPAASIRPRVESLGKPFAVVERGPVIV